MKQFAFRLMLGVMVAMPAQAHWVLDGENSTISFVSTKAINIAEVHKFGELSGGVDDEGNVSLSIGLESVDTNIELRDDRMREMLFETEEFNAATVKATVDAESLGKLEAGQSIRMTVDGEVSLHGTSKPIPMDLVIAKTGDNSLLVTSEKPVVVNAAEFALSDGVERLREVAGLPSISLAVPVSFVLTFGRN